jgi:hypothetical protein
LSSSNSNANSTTTSNHGCSQDKSEDGGVRQPVSVSTTSSSICATFVPYGSRARERHLSQVSGASRLCTSVRWHCYHKCWFLLLLLVMATLL